MDEFDRAQIRSMKRRGWRLKHQPLVEKPYGFSRDDEPQYSETGYPEPTRPVPPLSKVTTQHAPIKTPMKRTNEIGITIYIDGQVIELTARVNLGDIIGSQRNRQGLTVLLKEALSSRFGKVEVA
jgi:hypothetical protein